MQKSLQIAHQSGADPEILAAGGNVGLGTKPPAVGVSEIWRRSLQKLATFEDLSSK